MRPAKTRISLGIRPIWSESSLGAHWVAKDQSFLHADSEDSDQAGRMPRLIWVFAGRTVILLLFPWGGSNATAGRKPAQFDILSSHLSRPLSSVVFGAPLMTLQQYLSIFMSSAALRESPFLSILWCYLPISSSVFLSFLVLCRIVFMAMPSEFPFLHHGYIGGHHALQLHSGFCCEPTNLMLGQLNYSRCCQLCG